MSTCQLEESIPIGITQVLWFLCSDLELKPHGKLTVTVVRADSLKNKELIGKSDPYVVLFIRPIFKEKTRVIDDNLNPEWNETFELIAEDKETQSLVLEVDMTNSLNLNCFSLDGKQVGEIGLIFSRRFQVFDEDKLKQDKRLGIAKLPLSDLGMETAQEVNLQLLSSLDTTKVKDKKDRGVLTIKARSIDPSSGSRCCYHVRVIALPLMTPACAILRRCCTTSSPRQRR